MVLINVTELIDGGIEMDTGCDAGGDDVGVRVV